MVINLKKGEKINLSKTVEKLTTTSVGLGWDVLKPKKQKGLFGSIFGSITGETADLDAGIYMTGKNTKEIVYFGHLHSKDGSIIHQGDNLTGDGDGDDEVINVDFSKVDEKFDKLSVVVNIFRASSKGQTFNDIKNAYVHVLDNKNKELVRYNLTDDMGNSTGVIIGEFKRIGNDWEFVAVGKGTNVANISDFNV